MAQINDVGRRNEYWMARLANGPAPEPQFARLFITRGANLHPRGMEALRLLLDGPTQDHDDIDPYGDRDMRKVTLDGTKFYLKVDCYAPADDLQWGSESPEDDAKTTRVFTCLLADEY